MTARIAPALSAIALSAIALFAAAPVAAAVSDFRLPPSAPSPTSRAQGPVDPDDPATRPAAVPTPTPTPAPAPARPAAAPTATPAPAPRLTPPRATPAPRATASAGAPVAQSPPLGPEELTASAPLPALPTAFPTALPSPAGSSASEDGEGSPWLWLALGTMLALAAAAGWYYRRKLLPRRGLVLMVPDIEKPRVPAAPAPAPEPAPEPALPAPPDEPTHPLLIAITPLKLTQTFMNEALSYRLSITNVGALPVGPIAVSADLAAAHASLSREEQLAGPATVLPERHSLAEIAPGEQVELTGEIRTPLADLAVIRQGSAALLVPLARFRLTAPAMETRHFTLAVGQQQPGTTSLAPIRLDLGPRTTDGLAGRAF